MQRNSFATWREFGCCHARGAMNIYRHMFCLALVSTEVYAYCGSKSCGGTRDGSVRNVIRGVVFHPEASFFVYKMNPPCTASSQQHSIGHSSTRLIPQYTRRDTQ